MCQASSLSFVMLALNSALALFGMAVPINSTLVQMLLNLNLISKLLLGDVSFRDLFSQLCVTRWHLWCLKSG